MRILFLALDVDLSSRTGDSTHVRELASSLRGAGNELELVCRVTNTSDREVCSTVGGMRLPIRIPKKYNDLSTLRFCSQVAKRFKPDVIYERRFSSKLGATLSVLHGLPLVVEVNGLEEELEVLGLMNGMRGIAERAKKLVRRRFFGRADKIVAVTDGIRTGLKREYEIPSKKIVVIHNGANTDLFRPMDKRSCRRSLDLDPEETYICYVGSLSWWQGVDDAIRALPKVQEKLQEANLLIVGDGPQRTELEDLAKGLNCADSVHFVGKVPYEKAPLCINAGDVCLAPKKVLSSGYSPLKLYEYMACARPVIASRVPGFEILEQGAGMLFEPEESDDLATKIITILASDEMMESMGEKGREIVEKEYDWDRVAERISNILQEVIN